MTAEDLAFTFKLYLEQGITEYREVYSQFVERRRGAGAV